MKVLCPRILLLTVCATALLGGCGSSSNSTPTDEGAFDDPTTGVGTDSGEDTGSETDTDTEGDTGSETGTDTEGDTGSETGTDTEGDTGSETGTDTGGDTGSETGTDTGGDTGSETDTDAGGDTGSETDTDTGGDTGSETDTDAGGDTGSETDTDTEGDTGSETDTDTGGDTDSETGEGTGETGSDADIFVPEITAGSDLDRLVKGIKRQVSLTLLDLNKSLSEGTTLTDLQETCLGAYDPAVGEQLLSIDCGGDELATGDVSVYVTEAAFYATDSCHASLFNGNTDNCQLQRAGIRLPDVWTILDGERRPTLTFADRNVSYALTDTLLQITNTESALAGIFACDYDLATSTSTSSLAPGSSCADIIPATADNLDAVVPQ